MTDLLLVILINFFALYTTSQYLAVLKKEEQKKGENYGVSSLYRHP